MVKFCSSVKEIIAVVFFINFSTTKLELVFFYKNCQLFKVMLELYVKQSQSIGVLT